MKVRYKPSRIIAAVLFLCLTLIWILTLAAWLSGLLPGQGAGVIILSVIWGFCGGVLLRMMRKTPWKGFDCVAGCFHKRELAERMAGEQFVPVSKYLSVSQYWLCFRGQYVPKHFVIGAYAVSSMDQSDTLHLALITGETCHDFIHERDTIAQLEQLHALLPQADILCGGSRFTRWWAENRTRLSSQTRTWIKEGRDFWELVYVWRNVAGWNVTPPDGQVDDSEEYFRDYPQERQDSGPRNQNHSGKGIWQR